MAEALVTPNVNKPVLTADVDNPYRERYRNEHFENTVLRTLLGLPLKNAGDDLNYRPADSYAVQLQRCPWGLQVPPGWTPENDDFDKDDKERDSEMPPLEDWNAEAARQRDRQPRETRREREGRRDTSSRDQSRRGDQSRARGRERGQGDHGSRERQERGGRHASRGRDDRSQRERSRGRHASKDRDNRSQRERSRGRHASKGRDSRAQRENREVERATPGEIGHAVRNVVLIRRPAVSIRGTAGSEGKVRMSWTGYAKSTPGIREGAVTNERTIPGRKK